MGVCLSRWNGDSLLVRQLEDQLREVAWYAANNDVPEPKVVAQLKPNPFGLYDMHGNLWEWVHDAWRPNTYTLMTGPGAVDPRCDLGVDLLRVIRGGDHFMSAAEQRSACRDAYPQDSIGTMSVFVLLSLWMQSVSDWSTPTQLPPDRHRSLHEHRSARKHSEN